MYDSLCDICQLTERGKRPIPSGFRGGGIQGKCPGEYVQGEMSGYSRNTLLPNIVLLYQIPLL